MQGKIIKGVGGFYYIHLQDNRIFECKAKGAFRNQNIKPAVGDNVDIKIIDEDKLTGNIVSIMPRHNTLIRPAVANVDQAVIIFALTNPEPNYNLLDRFLVMMDKQDVRTIICFNKSDLVSEEEAQSIKQVYSSCGYDVIITSTYSMGQDDSDGVAALRRILDGKTTVFAGPSGVGKSSMLNIFKTDGMVETGEISEKIKRGKHTTRHSELIFIWENTFIMDTPGFSSLYVEDMEPEDLKEYYNEFEEYSDMCRFNGCVHIKEPDCGVKRAVESGDISKLRYDNYMQLYDELKNKRRW
ncbi:MAG: ribosome small subunit-dependent GTPase A [Lachnospiraceae bacterium]|nr:ribosome small subunit-dependent GTPase A [Lachnospiraceae bacterium]